MQFWAIIVDGFRESRDRKIFWVVLLISVIVAAAMACVSVGDGEINILFGAWVHDISEYPTVARHGESALVGVAIYWFMDLFLGWIGMMLIIVATANIFPAMMERGAVDVLVSKPISRTRLFLYKYAGSLVFVFVQATIFVVLTFLVMGLRWSTWVPGYLWCIPLLVLLFSYVNCVSVLIGVKTGSSLAAVLLTLGAWFFFVCPKIALDAMDSIPEFKTEDSRVYQAVKVVSWIPPKTSDITYLAARAADAVPSVDLMPSTVTEQSPPGQMEAAREIEEKEFAKSPVASIGSSLAFEAVVLGLALWIFVRRDF